MTDETQNNETGSNVDETAANYIATIKELKEKTVDRSKYEQLVAENKKLLDSVINGETVEKNEEQPRESVTDLRKSIFSGELNNLDYAVKTLELRKQLMESGKGDPFLPVGHQISPTNEDIECANKVAQVIQECIDYAEGDAQVFTNELQRRTIDVRIR